MELLRTPRLLLRRWQNDDLAAYYAIYSQWEVMRWLGAPPRRAVTDLAEARERLARWHHREAGLTPPLGFWALQPLSEAAGPVGTVLLLPLHDDQGVTGQIEIGWHLHPAYQKQGLVTEAANAVLNAAETAGISTVLALTDPDNTASQAVARRLGMAEQGMTDRWFNITTRQFARAANHPSSTEAARPDQS
ncbi:RimJ/RimL family protein N-acetyltransferase [Krasilnikovia cinnamomea]|uniref:RimJ/RimL family protein N-acetyltransferase n=1 Tax=Krasilnikovia cinnamomea TaxID=349313 RepID=A0A4Q7Z9R9_9ACTN|nr:GNAT family N-acetyltransferase [Krasilnikovia cinnamomea]RZU46613.1 RimJ/RimL family protein N-acetyltransferase [Krasilnikovia cinnamomea]